MEYFTQDSRKLFRSFHVIFIELTFGNLHWNIALTFLEAYKKANNVIFLKVLVTFLNIEESFRWNIS